MLEFHRLLLLITNYSHLDLRTNKFEQNWYSWHRFMGSRIMGSIGWCSNSQTGGRNPFYGGKVFFKGRQNLPVFLCIDNLDKAWLENF
jgi:hypothetical protein